MLTSGNKIETVTDFESSGEMPLTLTRTYNRNWTYAGLFGMNWVSSFDYSITAPSPEADAWVQRPDGRRIRFVWNAKTKDWDEDKAGPIAKLKQNPDGSFTHLTEFGGTERYNAAGRPLQILNRQGIGWTYTYSASWGVIPPSIGITHTSGRFVTIRYNSDFQVDNVSDPDGALYEYDYDDSALGFLLHRLKSVSTPGPNPTVTTYHYEKAGQPDALTGVSYNGQRHSTFDYDNTGRAISTVHAGNVERFTFAYTGSNSPGGNPPGDPPNPQCNPVTGACPQPPLNPEFARRQAEYEAIRNIVRQPKALTVVSETNPLGRVTFHDMQSSLRKITESRGQASIHCPSSLAKRFYDSAGNMDRSEDFNGNTIDYSFNAAGQMTSQTEGFGTTVARTTSYDWDVPKNRPNSITVSGMQRTTYSYRPDDRIDAITVRNLSAIGTPNQDRVIDYDYTLHANGLVATMTVDGPITGTTDLVTSTYSTTGDLLTVSNSLGHTVTYSNYNGRGQAGRMVGVNGDQTDYVYDARGRLTTLTTNRNNLARTTTWAYTASDLLDSITYPDGVVESYGYDTARRVTSITRAEVDGTFKREFTYDNASNITVEKGFIGPDLVFQKFTEFDEQNRVRERRGNPTTLFATQFLLTYKYDLNSNLTELKPVIGPATFYEYDALDRLKKMTDPTGGIALYAYDKLDQPTSITDPRNKVTTYETDGFGQTWKQISPDTGTTAHVWNAAGQRTSSTRADKVTLTYGYDGLGRPTTVTTGTETRTTTWDTGTNCLNGLGRICSLTDPHQTLHLSYLKEGELTAQRATIGADTYIQTFDYDPIGRLTGIAYPGNVRVDYQWAAGRQTGMTATINGGAPQTVVSNAARRFVTEGDANVLGDEFNYGNGKLRADGFDKDGRLRGRFTTGKQGFNLRRDANGRITQFENFFDLGQSFGYDPLNRLTSIVAPVYGNQAFGYDLNSNRTSHTRNASPAQLFTINAANNRIDSVTGFARSYTYKPTGQITAITGGPADLISESRFETPLRNLNFSYDTFNRLNGVTGQNLTATYKIAATNMRVEKTVNGRTTRFNYSLDGKLLHERDLATNRDTQHLYFQGEPVGMVRNNTLYFVLPDHLGRPELLMANTPAATTMWRVALSAFERAQTLTDNVGGYNIGFPGQYHDEETGYAYNINRDYDPATGRYLQSDPIGLAGGMDTYGYVGGNPVDFIDPLGLLQFSFAYYSRRFVGFTVDIGIDGSGIQSFTLKGGLGAGMGFTIDPIDTNPDNKPQCEASDGVGVYAEAAAALGPAGLGVEVNAGGTRSFVNGLPNWQGYSSFESLTSLSPTLRMGRAAYAGAGFEVTKYFNQKSCSCKK